MWPLIRIYSVQTINQRSQKQLLVTLQPEMSGLLEDLGLTLARYLDRLRYTTASLMVTDLLLYLNTSRSVHIVCKVSDKPTDQPSYDVYFIEASEIILLGFDRLPFCDNDGITGSLFLGPPEQFLYKFRPNFA